MVCLVLVVTVEAGVTAVVGRKRDVRGGVPGGVVDSAASSLSANEVDKARVLKEDYQPTFKRYNPPICILPPALQPFHNILAFRDAHKTYRESILPRLLHVICPRRITEKPGQVDCFEREEIITGTRFTVSCGCRFWKESTGGRDDEVCGSEKR